VFPSDVDLSNEVVHLIQNLVCEENLRLGRNGVSEIKSHPWFKNFNWKGMYPTSIITTKKSHGFFNAESHRRRTSILLVIHSNTTTKITKDF
jgi:hypothetical protein